MKTRNYNIFNSIALLRIGMAVLFFSFAVQAFAQEGSGNWKRSQTDRTTELFVPANDAAYASVTGVEVCEEVIFFEDFGTSNLNDANYGRKVSTYMPSDSFAFGTPYPTSNNYDEFMIDNNHYSVVAPGYIKAGTDPNQYYFWSPAYTDANTVTDRSGTEEGAVMVINAGSTLLPFYQREYTVESNTTYRASFWLYLVNGPSKVAIDVINKTTGEVLGTVESELMEDWDTTYKGQWTQHTLHFATPEITPDCNLSDVIISLRNAHGANNGNDYYIDDIKFSKLVCDIPTEGVVEIKCPEFECPAGTDQVELSKNALSNSELPQVGESLFFDDFGASDLNNGNKGRVESPFMPDNGFDFGDSYLKLPTPTGNPWDDNPVRNAARINDGFYAVVAPGYINEGWFDNDGWESWWTPGYNESNPIYDYSGTETGAALVVNAGENRTAFYERNALIQAGAQYRASFKLFVVQAISQVGIDILDPVTRDVLYTMATDEYHIDYQHEDFTDWRSIEIEFTMPGSSCNAKDVVVSFRNHYAEIDGNDWYVDNIRLEKIQDASTCPPIEECVTNGKTSVNLNDAFEGTIPTGTTIVWYTTPDRSGEPVADPENIKESGLYYAFFYDAGNDCYNVEQSTAVVEVIIIPPCVSVIAIPDFNQTPQDTPVDGNVLTNDSGDNIIVTEISIRDASGAPKNVSVPNTGTVTEDVYAEDPNSPGNYIKTGTIKIDSEGHYTFTPEEGFTGNVPIEYTIEDEKGNTDNTTLTIEVIPTYNQSENSKPIAQDDAYTTIEGKTITSNILSNDSDADGDALAVTGITQGGITIQVGTATPVSGKDSQGNAVTNAGTVTIGSDGKITFVPTPGFVGKVDPINYKVSDGKGGTDDANIYLNVLPDTGVNSTFANDDANTAPKGQTITGNVLTNDFDPEGNTQNLISITIDGITTSIASTDTEVTILGKGKLTISPNGSYTFVPEPDFVGTVVVEQKVCDNGSPQACDDATLYLTTLDVKRTLLITNPMVRQRLTN